MSRLNAFVVAEDEVEVSGLCGLPGRAPHVKLLSMPGNVLLALLLGACALTGCGCSYSRVHSLSFQQAQARLLTSLQINEDSWQHYLEQCGPLMHPKQIQRLNSLPTVQRLILGGAHPEERLRRYMSNETYGTKVQAFHEDKRLCFTAFQEYDIFGQGGEYIIFDIEKVDDTHTRIRVDYSDRSLALLIIPWWNPGLIRERQLAKEIFSQPNLMEKN